MKDIVLIEYLQNSIKTKDEKLDNLIDKYNKLQLKNKTNRKLAISLASLLALSSIVNIIFLLYR